MRKLASQLSEVQHQLALETAAERRAQDLEHGGPAHDDLHTPSEWAAFVMYQCTRVHAAVMARDIDGDEIRSRLIKIAALAWAELESMDRSVIPQ